MAYALDHLEERTWAVIALDEASAGRVDYTIRMNFTVVPNTNTVVDMISIGLDPRYCRWIRHACMYTCMYESMYTP